MLFSRVCDPPRDVCICCCAYLRSYYSTVVILHYSTKFKVYVRHWYCVAVIHGTLHVCGILWGHDVIVRRSSTEHNSRYKRLWADHKLNCIASKQMCSRMGHQVIGEWCMDYPSQDYSCEWCRKKRCGDFECSGKTVRFRTRVPMLHLIVLISTTSPQSL